MLITPSTILPDALIHQVTEQCKKEHQIMIEDSNKEQKKNLKRLLQFWVTLPVGFLSALLITFLVFTNNSAVKSAEHRIATEKALEKQDEKIDT